MTGGRDQVSPGRCGRLPARSASPYALRVLRVRVVKRMWRPSSPLSSAGRYGQSPAVASVAQLAPASRTPDLVSVVVPLRNGARWIGVQLGALAAQDYNGRREVGVVADGSNDDGAGVGRC